MTVTFNDQQAVTGSLATLFAFLPQSDAYEILIKNVGANTVNFKMQHDVGAGWVDMGAEATEFNNTLTAGQARVIRVVSGAVNYQLLGSATGGSTVEFAVTTEIKRVSGGNMPLVSL